ncbi:MAG: hypothetical protein M1834_001446 [Cirrosporium novae-zelandiae]|nr:MAG: hypothetical protein M1834_001446 [Cirrosporium novae-zelandiae]
METYHGHVRTPADAIILFEACRLGLLPRVQRRLSEKERSAIKSGSVFVWDEREAGMRRWTDGKSWSASRVSGSFLTYREMEGKRGGNGYAPPAARAGKTPDSSKDDDTEMGGEDGPDGYRYKPDGLMKQSFSITTSAGQHLHLISYYSRSHPHAQSLQQPTNDPALRHIRPQKGMYPESTVHEQSSVPIVTRSPMPGTPYTVSPQMAGYAARNSASHPPNYSHPGYSWPPSPLATPPSHYPMHAYANGNLQPIVTSANHSPLHYGQAIAPPVTSAPTSTILDRPPPFPNTTLPPPQPLPPQMSAMQPTYLPSPSPRVAQAALIAAQAQAAQAQVQAQMLPQTQAQMLAQVPAYHSSSTPPMSKIDPRLMSGSPTQSVIKPPESHPSPRPSSASVDQMIKSEQTNGNTNVSTSSPATSGTTIPSIGAMLNGTSGSGDNADAKSDKSGDKNGSRSSSRSPGGTQKTKGPQDIPSEKFGFGEDMRALRVLDRAFSA